MNPWIVNASPLILLGKINRLHLLNDLAARKCAAVYGIPVIGTLGVLLKAKSSGALTKLRPEIDSLIAAGSMLSLQVIQEALRLAGESQ